jgi:hypothetical protein
MISHLSLLKCFLSFLLLANSSFASEIRLVFANETSINISAKLQKDQVVQDSAKFEAIKGKSLVMESQLSGIHCVSIDKKKSFYIYINDKADLEVIVDLEKGKFEVINSFESKLLNRIFENWHREVAILKTLPVIYNFTVTTNLFYKVYTAWFNTIINRYT